MRLGRNCMGSCGSRIQRTGADHRRCIVVPIAVTRRWQIIVILVLNIAIVWNNRGRFRRVHRWPFSFPFPKNQIRCSSCCCKKFNSAFCVRILSSECPEWWQLWRKRFFVFQKNAKFMHPKRVNHTYTNRGAPHDTFLAKKLEYVLTIMIAGNVQTRAIGIF